MGRAKPFESGVDAPFGRGIYRASLLRKSADDGGAMPVWLCGQSQAGDATDAADGISGDLPQTNTLVSQCRPSALPVLATRGHDHPPGSGVEHRHYVPAVAHRLCVLGSDLGLV